MDPPWVRFKKHPLQWLRIVIASATENMKKLALGHGAAFIFLLILLGIAPWETSSRAQANGPPGPGMELTTTYDRIQRAADRGELTLKEAVLLKAELLFVPSLIPKDSHYAPKPGEVKIKEEGLTGFYKEIHRVFPELNEQEKKFLKTLSPVLEGIITQKEKEEKGTKK